MLRVSIIVLISNFSFFFFLLPYVKCTKLSRVFSHDLIKDNIVSLTTLDQVPQVSSVHCSADQAPEIFVNLTIGTHKLSKIVTIF